MHVISLRKLVNFQLHAEKYIPSEHARAAFGQSFAATLSQVNWEFISKFSGPITNVKVVPFNVNDALTWLSTAPL